MKNSLFLFFLLPVFGIAQTKTALTSERLVAKNEKPREATSIVQDNYSLSNQQMTINGTSNLHNWHQKVETVSGKAVVNQGSDKSLSVQTLNIIVEVNSIKGDGSVMDKKAHSAMKADQFPEITFVLTDPVANIPYGVKAFSTTAKGQLTIAGKTKLILMPIKITVSDDKKILVSGTHLIKMSEYGIDPPTSLMGMLKTGDNITINFETTFSLIK